MAANTTDNTFTGQIGYFLSEILGNPASSLPKGAQWAVEFAKFPAVIKKVADFEPAKWNVSAAFDAITTAPIQKTKGCLLAHAVSVPGDSFATTNEGTQYGGLLRPTINSGGRNSENLTISFIDTNVSFVENVIRPWVIVTAHLGMIAYEEKDPLQYRTDVTFYQIGVTSPNLPPYVRHKITYYGVCPLNVGGEEYNYSATTTPQIRQVQFAYNYYTVDSSVNAAPSNLPTTQTIKVTPIIQQPASAEKILKSPDFASTVAGRNKRAADSRKTEKEFQQAAFEAGVRRTPPR